MPIFAREREVREQEVFDEAELSIHLFCRSKNSP